jgi:hypothetical protein
LTNEFIENNKELVDWKMLSEYGKIDSEFIKQFHDYIDWSIVCENHRLDHEIILKHHFNLDFEKIQKYDEKIQERYGHCEFPLRYINHYHPTKNPNNYVKNYVKRSKINKISLDLDKLNVSLDESVVSLDKLNVSLTKSTTLLELIKFDKMFDSRRKSFILNKSLIENK